MLTEIRKKLGNTAVRRPVVIALMASALFAVLLYLYLSGLEREQALQMHERIIVAAIDIPEKTVIQSTMLKTAALQPELVPNGAVREAGTVIGKIAKSKISRNEPLTEPQLIDAAMAGFTAKIPPDKRAISIAVTDTTGVSGFARPGDFVDIMLIADKGRTNAVSAAMVLQNVLLLAINKSTDTASGPRESIATATVAVSPQDTLRLGLSQSQGKLYLVLRPPNPPVDTVPVPELVVPQAEQVAPVQPQTSPPPVTAVPAVPVVAPEAVPGIPVIRGNSVSVEAIQ